MEELVRTGLVLVHGDVFDSVKIKNNQLWTNTFSLCKSFGKARSPFLAVKGTGTDVHYAMSVMEKLMPKGKDSRSAAREFSKTDEFKSLKTGLNKFTDYNFGLSKIIKGMDFFDFVDSIVEDHTRWGEKALAKLAGILKQKAAKKAVEIATNWKVREHKNTMLFSLVFTHNSKPKWLTKKESEKLDNAIKHFSGKRVVFFTGGFEGLCVKGLVDRMKKANPDIVPVIVDDTATGKPGEYEDIIGFESKSRDTHQYIDYRTHLQHVDTKDIDTPAKLQAKVHEFLSKT